MSLTSVESSKEQSPLGFQPLCLATFTFADGGQLFLSTYPLNTGEGGYPYDSNSYLARIVSCQFPAIQSRSELGIDRIASASLKLADPDFYLWNAFELNSAQGFCGALLTLTMILKDFNQIGRASCR